MTNTNRTATLELRVKTNKRDTAIARSNISVLRDELKKLDRQRSLSQAARDAAAFERESGNARKAVGRLKAELVKLEASDDEIKKVAREFDRLRNSAEAAAVATRQVATPLDAQGRFDAVSREVGLAGDIQSNLGAVSALSGNQNVAVAGELVALVEELPRLKTALQGFPSTLRSAADALGGRGLGLIGALAGLAVVLAFTAKQAERSREATDAFLQAQGRGIDATRTASREEIEARRRELQTNRDNARERLALLQEQERAFAEALNPLLRGAAELSSALGVSGDQTFASLRDQIASTSAEVNAAEVELRALNNALSDTEVQSRLAAERVAKLTDLIFDTAITAQLEADRFNSTSQLDERIAQLEREREVLQRVVDAGVVSEDALQRYNARILELGGLIEGFNDTVRSEVAAREAEIRAVERAERARAKIAERQEQFAALSEQARTATGRFNDALAQLETTLSDKLTKAAQERSAALVKAEQDAAEARAEAIRSRDSSLSEATRDAERDREKAAREHQKALTRIQREGNRASEVAIQDRDAVALEAARQAQAQQTDEANEGYREQQRDIDDNLREQNRTINQRYNEQTRTIAARLTQQTQAIATRYQQQVQAAQQAFVQEQQVLRQGYIQQISQLQIQLQNRLNIEARGAASLLGIQQQYWSQALALAGNALRSVTRSIPDARGRQIAVTPRTPAPRDGSRQRTAFDTGGYVERTGLAMVHAGEYVINPRRGQGAINFAPTINAGNRSQIIREVNRQLETLLDRAGL